MKIHRDVTQGSDAWRLLRLGVITGSEMERVVTPKTLKPSASQRDYVAELVAEELIGEPFDMAAGKWAERGTALEAEARAWYCLTHETVEEVGFISRDDGRVGCSPDGIIEGKRGLEIKCPAAKNHVRYLLDSSLLVADYRLQVQTALWLTGWPVWTMVSYCPGLPEVVVDVGPDAEVFSALEVEVPKVLAARAAALSQIEGR